MNRVLLAPPPQSDRWARRLLLPLVGLIAIWPTLLTGVAAPAEADGYADCTSTTGCRPDSFTHNYCFNSPMSSDFRSAIRSAMVNMDTQTSMTDSENGCDTNTDVLWSSTTSISTRGEYLCLRFESGNTCNSSRVRLNPDQLTTLAQTRKTACHELGHSLGLMHGDTTDCMINGSSTLNTYNLHH